MRRADGGTLVTLLAQVFAAAAVVALVLTPLVRALAHRIGALDHPGERKSHEISMPRLGGVAIVIAWIGAIVWATTLDPAMWTTPLLPIVFGAMVVFAVGVLDDLRPLPATVKLLAEVLAAASAIGGGTLIERVTLFGVTMHLGWFSVTATILWVLAITNAFNLLDGLDGLATGLAIIAGVTCASIVVIRGDYQTAVILIALLGALVGFLPFNFKPATIFLGDSGSLLIGYLLAVTAITGFQKGATALAAGVPLLIFGLPLLDTVSAVIRRGVRSQRRPRGSGVGALAEMLAADRGHIHHMLMTRGLSHRATVLVLYAVAICLSSVAFLTIER